MSKIAEILVDGSPVDKAALRDYLASREVVNARDFGVEPGAARDAAPGLQAAIDAAHGAVVFVPAGSYRIATPLIHRAPAIVDGHVPGLKLVGAGAGVTRFECRVAEGAALRIDQSIGYTFSQNGLIEGIEFAGAGPTLPDQDAIAVSGAWHYRFVDLRIRGFGRHGISCPYRHDLASVFAGVIGTRGSDRLQREAGGFMTRLRPGDRLTGRGLAAAATVLDVIDDRTIRMSAPATESGAFELGFGGNTDAFQTILHLERCAIAGNGGWGIEGSGGLGLLLSWTDCAVQECRQGGVMVGGGTRLDRGIIAANGRDAGPHAAGLRLIRAPGTPQLLHVENVEFDSNHGTQVWLHYAANARFYQCRFISHAYPTPDGCAAMVPPSGIHLGGRDGGPGGARDVELAQCAWRADAQYGLPFRAIGFGTPGSYGDVRVTQPLWITLTPPHQVKYAPEPHPDSGVRIEEDGAPSLAAGAQRPMLVLRKLAAQTVAPGVDTTILFDSVLQANGFVEMRVSLAQTYLMELWVALAGLGAGDPVTLAVLVDQTVWREGRFRAGGLSHETFQLNGVGPLPKDARVGARMRVDGAAPCSIVGGPGLAGFSVVALT